MQSKMAIKPFANGELPSFPNNKDVSLDDNINAYTSKHLHNANMQYIGFFTFISLNCMIPTLTAYCLNIKLS